MCYNPHLWTLHGVCASSGKSFNEGCFLLCGWKNIFIPRDLLRAQSVCVCTSFWYKLLSLLGFVLQGRLKDVLSNRWMYYLALARPQPEQCSPTTCSVFPLELDVCFSLLARFLLAAGHTHTKGFLEMHCSLKSRVLNGRLQPAKISDFIHLCILFFF